MISEDVQRPSRLFFCRRELMKGFSRNDVAYMHQLARNIGWPLLVLANVFDIGFEKDKVVVENRLWMR